MDWRGITRLGVDGRAIPILRTRGGKLQTCLDSQLRQLAANRLATQSATSAMDHRRSSSFECLDQKILERTETLLTHEAAERALAAFGQFALWQDPSFAVNPDVFDGAMWIVEGRKGSAYHAVLRSNVVQEALRQLALTLFEVSGMNPGKIREE